MRLRWCGFGLVGGCADCCGLVPRRGLEPPRGCPHWHLKPARLPIPPPRPRCCLASRGGYPPEARQGAWNSQRFCVLRPFMSIDSGIDSSPCRILRQEGLEAVRDFACSSPFPAPFPGSIGGRMPILRERASRSLFARSPSRRGASLRPLLAPFLRETHKYIHVACSGILPPILPEEGSKQRAWECRSSQGSRQPKPLCAFPSRGSVGGRDAAAKPHGWVHASPARGERAKRRTRSGMRFPEEGGRERLELRAQGGYAQMARRDCAHLY